LNRFTGLGVVAQAIGCGTGRRTFRESLFRGDFALQGGIAIWNQGSADLFV